MSAADDLSQLYVQREDWTKRAACRGIANPSLFFPSRGEPTNAARAICAACPVREECLDYALRYGIQQGIWGGASERERRRMRAARRVEAGLPRTGPVRRTEDGVA